MAFVMRWWYEGEDDRSYHHSTHVGAEDYSKGKWFDSVDGGVSSRQSRRPEKDEHVHAAFEETGGETDGDDFRIYIMSTFLISRDIRVV